MRIEYMPSLSIAAIAGKLGRGAVAATVALATLSLLAVDAGAVSSSVRSACKKDYYRFCPKYDVGTPQLKNCMAQAGRRHALTPRCLDALVDAGDVPRKYKKKN
jgi:hypothetical protein